ncbi:MAG TPA: glutamate--tRNA ligase [Candidatus Aquicultor sp.]|jgi:glutamyl-tRNA synthetase
MEGKIRVRFAPSPTGYLHIGGARTALFNWLYARHNNGVFVLRIEDTDRERSTEEAIHAIIASMDWLGLTWDEGPFRQMDRLDRYREEAERLLAMGKAYKCYCTPEELEERRKAALERKEAPRYDRTCCTLTEAEQQAFEVQGRKPVIRFYSPNEGTTIINDLVKGAVSFENINLDDFIMIRTDGIPTYNFAVVVDDHDMNISHVIRGDDHLSNTPRQILVYQALGYEVPEFGHLPMILGSDKTRLSKRHGATAVESYRDDGYLPYALINYLALLGWGFGDQTIFSEDELIQKFSLEGVGKSPAVFDPAKLDWLNGVYIRELSVDELAEKLKVFLKNAGIIPQAPVSEEEDYALKGDRGLDLGRYNDAWYRRLAEIVRERMVKLSEIVGLADFFFRKVEYQPEAVEKVLKKEGVPDILRKSLEVLADTSFEFSSEEIEKHLRGFAEETGMKARFVLQPIRVAVTGRTISPPLFETIELLGRETTLERLSEAISLLEMAAG